METHHRHLSMYYYYNYLYTICYFPPDGRSICRTTKKPMSNVRTTTPSHMRRKRTLLYKRNWATASPVCEISFENTRQGVLSPGPGPRSRSPASPPILKESNDIPTPLRATGTSGRSRITGRGSGRTGPREKCRRRRVERPA